MAVNLTITVPEELHQRLQEVKKNFNVSKACQEAIETEVKRQELLQSGLDNMKDVIERLRLEKAQLANQSFDVGYKYGLKVLKGISYEEIELVNRYRSDFTDLFDHEVLREGTWAGHCISQLAEGYTDDFLEYHGDEEDQMKYLGEKVTVVHLDEDLFVKGFFQSIFEFYDKIKDQL